MTPRIILTLALSACMASACMETAPVPGWVYACQDAQGDPECVPEDARSDPGPAGE
jgi:hypothetical protein